MALLAYANLEMPAYTWGSSAPFDDLRSYAQQFGGMRAIRALRPDRPGAWVIPVVPHADVALWTLRRGMWWNLADYALVMGTARSIRYIATGERETTNPAGGWAAGRSCRVPGSA